MNKKSYAWLEGYYAFHSPNIQKDWKNPYEKSTPEYNDWKLGENQAYLDWLEAP